MRMRIQGRDWGYSKKVLGRLRWVDSLLPGSQWVGGGGTLFAQGERNEV